MNVLTIKLSKKETIVGYCYLVFQLIFLPIVILVLAEISNRSFTETELNFAIFAVNFIATTIIFRNLIIKCGIISLQELRRTIFSALKGFGFYWLGSTLVSILITVLSPNFQNVNDASISILAEENYALVFIMTVLLAPITEELLYRGLVFGSLHKKNRILAYVLSSLFFASLHILSYVRIYPVQTLLLCLMQYLPAGFAMAYAYEKADSIWAPILIHMTNNLIATILI